MFRVLERCKKITQAGIFLFNGTHVLLKIGMMVPIGVWTNSLEGFKKFLKLPKLQGFKVWIFGKIQFTESNISNALFKLEQNLEYKI
jgi:hypothetical protein